MSIRVRIPPFLRKSTAGRRVVETTGRNVGECFDDLETQFPGIKQLLCDQQGRLDEFIEVFINSESSYPEELSKPVKDGDELTIAIFIAGG